MRALEVEKAPVKSRFVEAENKARLMDADAKSRVLEAKAKIMAEENRIMLTDLPPSPIPCKRLRSSRSKR
jgi:regulator of extracellular matrix RemA (YlzA/DUF370 family)